MSMLLLLQYEINLSKSKVSDINVQTLKEERKVLSITSLAEFAERYGYYVIQSLLISIL